MLKWHIKCGTAQVYLWVCVSVVFATDYRISLERSYSLGNSAWNIFAFVTLRNVDNVIPIQYDIFYHVCVH